ncbi:uncharacterized protein [Nicotiana tomentosiformis]|uniref:uncharacterized protein n=1 Tax=Nicotiana tomentosiformis TaxID=4098 RepID=UPI00388C7D40
MSTDASTTFSTVESTISHSIDSSHPLYVHLSDSLGSLLVPVPFNGTSYAPWKKNILIALSAINKAGMINGRISQPPLGFPPYDHWGDTTTCVLHCDTAGEIWRDIEERKLWDELKTASFGPSCTCGAEPQCSEGQKLIHFLIGLNDTYSNMRRNILMITLVATLGKAYSMLLNDENHRELQSSGANFLSEFASFSCYKLHGFPVDFKFTKGKKSAACAQIDELMMNSSSSSEGPTCAPTHGFTREKYQHLMNLFQQSYLTTPVQDLPTSNAAMRAFAGFSLKRPLGIGRAQNKLYVIQSSFELLKLVLSNLSPYEKLHGYPPIYNHFRTFGCLYYATLPKIRRDKFQPRASPCVFLGYPLGKKGYKLLNLDTHYVFFSRDVTFYEHISPYHSSTHSSVPPFYSVSAPTLAFFEDIQPFTPTTSYVQPPPTPFIYLYSPPPIAIPHSYSTSPSYLIPHAPCTDHAPPIHSTRVSDARSYLKDYICTSVSSDTQSKLSLPVSPLHEPQYFLQAAPHPAWQDDMLKEFQALDANYT